MEALDVASAEPLFSLSALSAKIDGDRDADDNTSRQSIRKVLHASELDRHAKASFDGDLQGRLESKIVMTLSGVRHAARNWRWFVTGFFLVFYS
jgi:hypothetical protein